MSDRHTIKLVYLSQSQTGGWVTYVYHLHWALRMVGYKPEIYKIRQRTESKTRYFGYHLEYRNVTWAEALRLPGATFIVALNKAEVPVAQHLLSEGAAMVVHDPTELKRLPDLVVFAAQCVVNRRIGLEFLPGATHIPHPYGRLNLNNEPSSGQAHAIAVSRIDFDKHTEMILEANQLLPEALRVRIYGDENRRYTKAVIMPRFPDWQQCQVRYPREADYAYKLCHQARYMVDMSAIKGDGGDTQYTFLEAMDAGAVPVLNQAWILEGGEMQPGVNCLAVGSGQELANLLRRPRVLHGLHMNAIELLGRHSPQAIGPLYRKFFEQHGVWS